MVLAVLIVVCLVVIVYCVRTSVVTIRRMGKMLRDEIPFDADQLGLGGIEIKSTNDAYEIAIGNCVMKGFLAIVALIGLLFFSFIFFAVFEMGMQL